MKKKITSVLLVIVMMILPLGIGATAIESDDYTLVSPYASVDWDTWKQYKGNLHTHSSVSDGNASFRDMIYGAYEQGFDLLGFSEHGITGKAWDQQPFIRPLYLYQVFTGNSRKPLTSEEFAAITDGSAPLENGQARGKGMFCVTGANELNAVALTMSHVNGYFLPSWFGNLNWGFENGQEAAVAAIEKLGGLSHINHPGDWLVCDGKIDKVMDPKNIKYFSEILLKYPSCLGLEAVNGFTSVTPYDRVLWDNVLMYCLPYGRNVYGFTSSDAHSVGRLDDCFNYYIMPETSMTAMRECLENGTFFGATHKVVANNIIGPKNDINMSTGKDLPLPQIGYLKVDGHRISMKVGNTGYVQWIANGKPLVRNDVNGDGVVTIDLDEFDTDGMLYVRCEVYNENGMTYSQAITLDRGNEALEYKPDTGFKATMQKVGFVLSSTRVYVIISKLIYWIGKAINK